MAVTGFKVEFSSSSEERKFRSSADCRSWHLVGDAGSSKGWREAKGLRSGDARGETRGDEATVKSRASLPTGDSCSRAQ